MFFPAGKNHLKNMQKAKILIIEDDRFLLKLYTDKLKREGFEVSSSLTGTEGLNKIFAEKPDFVVLDLVLPGKNGFEVLSEMKLNPKTKNIPVIIISNLGQELDVKRGMELGAVDYLIKTDFSMNQLPGIIKEHFAKEKRK